MRAYSLDLRTHLIEAITSGIDPQEVARVFGVSRRTIRRYQHQLAATGSLAAKPIPGRPRQITAARAPLLEDQLRAHPDATLVVQCQLWHETQQVKLSPATMSRAIARLGWTWKKKCWWPASATKPSGASGGTRSPTSMPSSSSSS